MASASCPADDTVAECGGFRGLPRKKTIPSLQKVFYGVGHVLNDLCANCWFSYLLLYMTKVVGLSDGSAGLILLIGQIADGLFTPFIGYGCDHTTWRHYGKRKLWHLIGTGSVMVSFPFVFNLCISCGSASSTTKVLYYSAFVIVFQFGWAATQISHLSLIPEIASRVSEKVELNAIRSGLTFVCGIYVFGVTWLLLGTNDDSHVTPNVSKQFMYLAFIVVGTGLFFSSIFHIGTREPKPVPKDGTRTNNCLSKYLSKGSQKLERGLSTEKPTDTLRQNSNGTEDDDRQGLITIASKKKNEKTWKCWFKTSLFYKMAVVYMCTRLTLNVSQSYFVLYLTDALEFEKEAIAYFPLLVLISGVIASLCVKLLAKRIGSKCTYLVGTLAAIGACVWFYMLPRGHSKGAYAAAALMGAGSSVMLVTSLAMTADLIGTNKSSGAFVYSAMSFTDKLSSGIVIAVIQVFKPKADSVAFCEKCALFLRMIQSVVPGVAAIMALACVAMFFPSDYIWRQRVRQHDACTQTLDSDAVDGRASSDNDSSSENDSRVTPMGCSLEVPFDPKLNRLSWHSAMTSYIGSRLAASHLRSPVLSRRQFSDTSSNGCADPIN